MDIFVVFLFDATKFVHITLHCPEFAAITTLSSTDEFADAVEQDGHIIIVLNCLAIVHAFELVLERWSTVVANQPKQLTSVKGRRF